MASHAYDVFYVLAEPIRRGVRAIQGCDTPTRTETADGTTYRCDWSPELRAAVVTRVGRAATASKKGT